VSCIKVGRSAIAGGTVVLGTSPAASMSSVFPAAISFFRGSELVHLQILLGALESWSLCSALPCWVNWLLNLAQRVLD
jgi:hypothetical protein